MTRTFRDGHAETWQAADATLGGWRPDGARRLVAVTADPGTLPDKATWYLVTSLPRPDGPRGEHSPWPAASLAEIVRVDHDLERRRRAARQLAEYASAFAKTAPQGLLDDAAGRLLSDADPLLRLHGVTVARGLCFACLYPRLRELENTETDPWVQHHLTRPLP